MKTISSFTILTGLVLSLNTWGSEGKLCSQTFDREEKIHALESRFQTEFYWSLNQQNREILRSIYNGEITATDVMKQHKIIEFLKDVRLSDRKLDAEAQELVDRNLVPAQKTALLISRLILRTDLSSESVVAVDKLLDVAGFEPDQRVALQTNHLITDRLTRNNSVDLIHEMELSTPKSAPVENERVFAQLRSEPLMPTSKRIQEVSPVLIQKLYMNLVAHPIASLMKLKEYDPTNTTGFCFGRAFAGHMEAIKLGIDKNSIRKVFVAGKLEGYWDYHVALMVRGLNNEWYVIDPIYSEPMPVRAWYNHLARDDRSGGKLRFFVTDAARFGPKGNSKYSKAGLLWEGYNRFFSDVIGYYAEMAKKEAALKSKPRPEPTAEKPPVRKKISQKIQDILQGILRDIRGA